MSALTRILNDVRMMKRNNLLRKKNDPKKVVLVLERILKESILVRNVDTKSELGKATLEELANIRNSLMMNKINAGAAKGDMVAKFSFLLDELSKNEESPEVERGAKDDVGGEEGASLLKNAFQRITENIPTGQTVTSALIASNPLLGYGTKMALDFSKSRRDYKRRSAEETKRRKELLQRQAETIQAQLDNVKSEEDIIEEKRDKLTDAPDIDSTSGFDCLDVTTLETLLQSIDNQLKELNAVWKDDVSGTDSLNDVKETYMKDTTKEFKEMSKEGKERNKLANLKRREEEILARKDVYGSFEGEEGHLKEKVDKGGLNFNMLGIGKMAGIMGLVSGIVGGIVSMFGSLLTPLMVVFKSVLSLGGKAGKLVNVLKMGGLLTAFFAVFDFVNYFFKAGEVLGKEFSATTIKERISIGLSALIDTMLRPIDWIAGLVGLNFLPEDKIESIKQILGTIQTPFDLLYSFITETIPDWFVRFQNLYESFKEGTRELFTKTIPEFIQSIGTFGVELKDSITEGFANFKESIIEKVKEVINSITLGFFGALDSVKESMGNIKDKVGGWLGLGGEDSDTSLQDDRDTLDRIKQRQRSGEVLSEILSNSVGNDLNIQTKGNGSFSNSLNNISGGNFLDNLRLNPEQALGNSKEIRDIIRKDSEIENTMKVIEKSLSKGGGGDINLTPISNSSVNNVRNSTVRPFSSNSSNNDPAHRRFSNNNNSFMYR